MARSSATINVMTATAVLQGRRRLKLDFGEVELLSGSRWKGPADFVSMPIQGPPKSGARRSLQSDRLLRLLMEDIRRKSRQRRASPLA